MGSQSLRKCRRCSAAGVCLCINLTLRASLAAAYSRSASAWCSANTLSSISLQVTLRNVGFGRRIWRRMCWEKLSRRDRGTWMSDRVTGKREMVTLSVITQLAKNLRGGEVKKKMTEQREWRKRRESDEWYMQDVLLWGWSECPFPNRHGPI